ncbi:Bor/Iss family lipoprotein [Runella slithyformis]|uniref:Lipoprotein n=1 Tax=Runella slithyformis (strain ATCC 29530 / DSM 19594 / LMG 11500 / NCIMB 11436 / LSU 4) TaxID=761193 RepID=A0A7U3ZI69_RUNSL|nr:hypothetical protein [Runella slithyformis]AEI47687.1 hypothetical protein Runsl_1260 [Runella slithyformis DSM 19594]
MKNSLFLICILLTGCYSNYHTIGNGPNRHSTKEIYSKGKDVYFLWGLVKLGDSEPKRPEKDYLIKTGFTLGDDLISLFTLGIVSTRTTKIFISDQPLNNQESIPKIITLEDYKRLPEPTKLEAGDFVYFLKNNEVRKGRLIKIQSYRSRVQEYEGIYKRMRYLDIENYLIKKAAQ